MADKRARLIVALEDLVSGKIRNITDLYSGLKLVVAGLNETFGRGLEFIKDTVKAYAESEQATIRLNNALRNQGFYSEEYSRALQQNAKDLSKVSTQSDETIMDTQTLLTTFGLAGDQLQKTTKNALDLSAGLGIDLRTATLMLGKAWAGETTTLGRYGLKVDETKSSVEKFAQIQDMVSQRFGGRASADAESYTGKITKLAEAWGNLQEKIGEDFAKASESSVTSLTRLLDVVEKNYEAIKKFSTVTSSMDSFQEVVTGIGAKAGIALLGMAEKVGISTDRYSELLAMMLKVKEAADNKGPEAKDAPKSKPQAEEAAKADNSEYKSVETHGSAIAARLAMDEEEAITRQAIMADVDLAAMENMGLMSEARATLKVQEQAAELQALGQHQEAKNLIERQGVKNAEAISKARVAGFLSTMNQIATLANSKSKALAAIGKAAAMAMTIRETAVAVMASYKWGAQFGGPPLGAAFGGMAAAAGAAQIATIAGTPLAEGGMLMHRSGGVPAIMAEAGHDEVAIPLDDERTQERLRGVMGGGGGGDTHHWHIGTLVADEGGRMELARMVDEKLFALERRNMRVSG